MLNRSLFLAPTAILAFTSLITLGGCAGSTDSNGTTGGTGGTSSSGGAPGTGGSVASGGTGNSSSGGSAGAGSVKMQPLPTLSDCADPTGALNRSCAMLGCHKGAYASAKLDLTPDMGLVGRLKDVPANHSDIICSDTGMVCASIPAACPTGDKLIDSSNVANSWMLHKLNGMQNGCGTAMPQPGYTITDPDKACIVSLVNAIAALK